ncbi:hypothetical protein BOX15_Mlig016159g2 [Macrostomum lignano]|uniref:Uncharacterized protein n=2 Tax=Macrostomum lignano TaxID=282301 RepID=A0A267DW94_9PLAT|nr:hypothetical protein BOX15_Mlig016159g1 [Macrostomum lignano]PAA92529.1 hypothetical protein BOX15_Mlig016159g2 [Macrostomum lignano]
MQSSSLENDSVNHSMPQYEELVTGVNCPTCNGTGKVPRDSEREYVALIPLSDKRLKPRRTVLWIGVTVSICLLLLIGTFCSLFFLLPRSIVLTSTKPLLQPYAVYFSHRERVMTMDIQNHVNLTNDNYFSITVTKIEMSIAYGDTSLCETANDTLTTSVGPRSLHLLSSRLVCRVATDSTESLVRFCSLPTDENLVYLRFNFAVTSSYMLDHKEEATISAVQIVNCSNTVVPTTLVPATTIQPTTTASTTTDSTTSSAIGSSSVTWTVSSTAYPFD